MPLSQFHEHMEELRADPASFPLEEWSLNRKFRVIGRVSVPPLDDILAVACPGIPQYGTPYINPFTGTTVPNAFLVSYEVEHTPNMRESTVKCLYSTRLPQPRNQGGLVSPVGQGQQQGQPSGGSSNPADLTQLLPKVSKGVEIIRLPYKEDPQGKAFYTDADGNRVPPDNPNFTFKRFCNTTGENFAAGVTTEVALPTYRISMYKLVDRDPFLNGNSVNNAVWDGLEAFTVYNKPETTSRELVSGFFFWLWNFELVYDPLFYHQYKILNAGFRQLSGNGRRADLFGARELEEIVMPNGDKPSVEVPLGFTGKAIFDPGKDGENLLFANFNKYDTTDFTTIPFKLTDFGFVV